MSQLWQLGVGQAHDLLSRREITSTELTRAFLARTRDVEDRVKAFITVTGDTALEHSTLADRAIAAGEGHPLTGIPVQVKDLICTAGIPTTCASRMLEDYIPVYDATAYRRIRDRGAVLLGKGNMDEFGMGSSCENSAFFPTGNPWDLSRIPGGSSGGGAAAVAAGEVPYALGSDTGGSIRQPAAMCGVVGLKPTYGLVSRYGLVAYASSLDQIGPIARSVADCALVLEALTGQDPKDATTLPGQPRDYISALTGDIRGMRIGVPEEYFGEGTQPGVSGAVREAIAVLESLGAAAFPVSLPTTPHALACYYIIAPSECSANLARYDGVKYGYSFQDTNDTWEAMEQTRERGFGMEVKRRIMLGAYALSSGYYDAYYLKAQQVRTLIREDFARVFREVDALATPTSPVVAFPKGEKVNDPVQMYLIDVCTLPVNIAGLPGISVPCGFSDGLPVGMQLIGPHLSEPNLLNLAHAYEQATDWHRMRPEG